MISPSGPGNITGVIDWQDLSVGPYFLKARFAECMLYSGDLVESSPGYMIPQLPSNYSDLPPDIQKDANGQLALGMRLKLYEARIIRRDRLRYLSFLSDHYDLVNPLMLQIPVAEHYGGLILLRECVRLIYLRWSDIAPPGVACPITFKEEDRERDKEELAKAVRYESASVDLFNRLHVLGDGNIPLDEFDSVKARVEAEAESWDYKLGPFPLQEGGLLITN